MTLCKKKIEANSQNFINHILFILKDEIFYFKILSLNFVLFLSLLYPICLYFSIEYTSTFANMCIDIFKICEDIFRKVLKFFKNQSVIKNKTLILISLKFILKEYVLVISILTKWYFATFNFYYLILCIYMQSAKKKEKKNWCETTTRLPLQAATRILNSMRCIFLYFY